LEGPPHFRFVGCVVCPAGQDDRRESIRETVPQHDEREHQRSPPESNGTDGPKWMNTNLAGRFGEQKRESLSPIPRLRLTLLIRFVKVANECLVIRCETPQKGGSESKRRASVHAVPPFSCGMPLQRAVKARCVSLTAFSPLPVTLKNRLALPPRSGVGSP